MFPGSAGKLTLSLDQTYLEARENADPKFEEQRGSLNLPIWDGVDSSLAMILRGQRTSFGQRVYFPEKGVELPEEFGAADIGLAWSRETLSGDQLSASATYGHAGTKLLDNGHSAIVSANFFYEDRGPTSSCLYFVNYSNNRPYLNNIPIPGVAYMSRGKSHTWIFGLPFIFLSWRPSLFSLTTSISPFGALIEPAFRIYGPLQIFGNLSWSPRSYQGVVKHGDDRLIADKKEVGGGLRMSFSKDASLSLGYIYAFDRRLLVARSLTDDAAESINVRDSGGFQIKGRLSY
ncbi:MAG: hypothetical protein AB7G93_11510 [Bdellovibrionales bacterium]